MERAYICLTMGRPSHGTKDEVSYQHFDCFNGENDPKTLDEAMKSQDVAFWKEAINDEIDSILGNNTWVLADLPSGFRQKSRIDYFDTYAPVARISTIRLLITLASIHNLIIHQRDVKIAFLNGELDKEVYMNQPQGFIMPGHENKKFLSSKFSMKDMGEADIILDIRIKHEMSTPVDTSEKLMPNNGQAVSQLEYSGVIGCLMYAMTCNPSTQHCSIIESKFMALAAAAPISIRYDNATTLEKAYSQMYNGKSRFLVISGLDSFRIKLQADESWRTKVDFVHNTPHNSNDEDINDHAVTLISKLGLIHPLHLHPNDYAALTIVFVKLKGTENYQVCSCAMLLALEGKNKTGFIDGSCVRSNSDEVLGRQWDIVNAIVLGWILNSIFEELFLG
ncbi:zinc finger, CCHC-type containing protein [Tanacetum coccineum]|uniref:Zinc finger, CCHC-type containing protein n=1 Tax=Tanacetum coccineum TaxID=301880 RepID=A0ABQ5GSN1_9ASTR